VAGARADEIKQFVRQDIRGQFGGHLCNQRALLARNATQALIPLVAFESYWHCRLYQVRRGRVFDVKIFANLLILVDHPNVLCIDQKNIAREDEECQSHHRRTSMQILK